jgi:hypothetical protein
VLTLFQVLSYWTEHYGSQYVGASSELPSANKEAISSSFERFLLTSTPYQELLMEIRKIYRWEDQMKTARWLAIYFILWTFNGIAGFAVNLQFYTPVMRGARGVILSVVDLLTCSLDLYSNMAGPKTTLLSSYDRRCPRRYQAVRGSDNDGAKPYAAG